MGKETTKESLKEELEMLKDSLSGNDIAVIAIDCECSIQTVYNYLNGSISNKFLAKGLIEASKKLISQKPNTQS